MKRFKAAAISVMVVVMATVVILEHQSRTKLKQEILSLKRDVQQLAGDVASLHQDYRSSLHATIEAPAAAPSDSQREELTRLRAEIGQLRQQVLALEQGHAAVSNQIASATGGNEPFVYPDSTRRKDYTFSGYAAPQSALQTLFWALTQADPKAFQASLTGDMATAFGQQVQELPDGVMPGGYKNGAMYKASGFRVLEEMPLGEDEMRLKVFLERSKIIIKPIFKKVGTEWKWARNEL